MPSVTGTLKDPKRAVSPEVHGTKPTNARDVRAVFIKLKFFHSTALEGAVQDCSIRIDRVAGHVGRLESGADYQIRAAREDRWVSDMVDMSVRPDDAVDSGKILSMCLQRVGDVTETLQFHDRIHNISASCKHGFERSRHSGEQVFHESKIEQDLLRPVV